MYTRMNNSGVEDICYEQEHVEGVLAATIASEIQEAKANNKPKREEKL